ncbi:MAG: type IV pilus modification protein PilV [Nitrosomonadales bacterium]|nr:type IV pilus modification protein PilV [Nitrosomonadales bacterium]
MRIFKGTTGKQSGMGMVEVLVTLVILLVGLLGLAGLMTQAQRSEMESYQRVQALVLLQDMVGRINVNRKVTSYQAVTVGTGAAAPVCPGGTIAQQDICQWHNAVLGTAEASGGNSVGAMIGARGCVSYDATSERINNSGQVVTTTVNGATVNTAIGAVIPNSGTYTVSVAWQGLGETAAPPASLDCGEGQYGNEAQRRVVSEPVRFATLTMQ